MRQWCSAYNLRVKQPFLSLAAFLRSRTVININTRPVETEMEGTQQAVYGTETDHSATRYPISRNKTYKGYLNVGNEFGYEPTET